MIPTVILVGVVIGRWWAIPFIGVAWAVLLSVEDVCTGGCSGGAFVFACANGAVGVAIHRGVRWLLSLLRRGRTRRRGEVRPS